MTTISDRNTIATIATLLVDVGERCGRTAPAPAARACASAPTAGRSRAAMAPWLPSIASRSRRACVAKLAVRLFRPWRRICDCSRSLASAARCRSLSARSSITGIVRSIVSRFLLASSAAVGGERQVIGVGGHHGGRKGLARLRQRRPDQASREPDRAVDDGVEPGDVARGLEHLVLVGARDARLRSPRRSSKPARNFSVASTSPLDRAGEHRVDRGAVAQRGQQRLAQQRDLGEHFRVGLIEIAMDQVLQAPGLALQRAPAAGRNRAPAARRSRPRSGSWRRPRSARRG